MIPVQAPKNIELKILVTMRDDTRSEEDILKLVTEIVTAYVSRNAVAAEDLPNVIKSVHATLGGIQGAESGASTRAPAVPVKKSVRSEERRVGKECSS